MVQTIMASILAVFLFMGINIPQQQTKQGVAATAASLFVPAAIAEEDKDSKDKADSKDDEGSKDEADSKDDKDSGDDHDSKSTSTSGVLICSALSVVEQKVSTGEDAEKKSAESEKEAKEAKDEAESKKTEVDDDDEASESEKDDADKHAKEKEDEFEKVKKEHDDAKSKLDEAKKELEVAKAAVTTAPCTTVGGQPGYWSNAAGTPVTTGTASAPKSFREVHGQ